MIEMFRSDGRGSRAAKIRFELFTKSRGDEAGLVEGRSDTLSYFLKVLEMVRNIIHISIKPEVKFADTPYFDPKDDKMKKVELVGLYAMAFGKTSRF